MIFIFEQQTPFNKESDSKYLSVPAYEDANLIYKALCLISSEELGLISEVHFLAAEVIECNIYKQVFGKYLGDINDYKFDLELVWEISDRFPQIDEICELDKKKKIEALIRETAFYSFSSSRGKKDYIKSLKNDKESYLLFLPYCKTVSYGLMEEINGQKIKLFSDIKSLKGRSPKKHIFIDTAKFLKIKNDLDKVKPIVKSQERGCSFQVKELIENIDGEFFRQVIDHRFSDKNRFHITGKDYFVANRVIDKILDHKDRHSYYMPQDLEIVQAKDKSAVVYDLDRVENNKDYIDLADKLNNKNETYKIIHALRKIKEQYFWQYEPVSLPSTEIYESLITSIFLGLILESHVYDGDPRKLGSFSGNVLNRLIPKTDSLKIIYEAIRDFKDVSFSDLRDNAGFWYYLNTIIEKKLQSNDEPQDYRLKKTIRIEKVDQGWEIDGLGKKLQVNRRGMLFLSIIIKYTQEKQKKNKPDDPIDSIKVLKIASEYLGKEYNIKNVDNREKTPEEYAWSTVSARISELNCKKPLQDFIDEHIELNSKESHYFHDKNKIEVEISDSRLDEIISRY